MTDEEKEELGLSENSEDDSEENYGDIQDDSEIDPDDLSDEEKAELGIDENDGQIDEDDSIQDDFELNIDDLSEEDKAELGLLDDDDETDNSSEEGLEDDSEIDLDDLSDEEKRALGLGDDDSDDDSYEEMKLQDDDSLSEEEELFDNDSDFENYNSDYKKKQKKITKDNFFVYKDANEKLSSLVNFTDKIQGAIDKKVDEINKLNTSKVIVVPEADTLNTQAVEKEQNNEEKSENTADNSNNDIFTDELGGDQFVSEDEILDE